jgi:predicted dehydrogenase
VIRVGVLGYGYWGPTLVRKLLAAPEVEVVAIADPDSRRRRAAADALPSARLSRDGDGVIGAADVDAVVVATPAASHHTLARAALLAGQHVLVEKPFTTSETEAESLVELAERRRRILMVDHPVVFSPAMAAVRELLAAGRLGDLQHYDSVRISDGRSRPGEDVMWDLAVHDLGCLDALRDDQPVAVSATGASYPAGAPASVAHVTLFYADDSIAHIQASWRSPVKVRRILVGGSRARLVIDDAEPRDKLRLYEGEGVVVPTLDGTEPLLVAVRHFASCITDGSRPLTDGRAGHRVVRVLEHASRSLADRGRPVELEP